jgi:two-component system phosphate regulon sensor histidine kinase PhoR
MLLIVGAIAGVPLLILAALTTAGHVGPGPALVAAVSVVGAALGAAVLRAREHRHLVAAIRHAVEGGPAPPGEYLIRDSDIARLVRVMSQRFDSVVQRLRTEEAIIESLPDPLIVLSPDRAVSRNNSAATAAFGAEMPAVLRHPGLRAAIDRTAAQGKAQAADLVLPVPVEREVHANVFPLPGSRVAVVLSDRTRERALERMRADFVANASHELRTPLASLIGFIDTLRGPAADDPPAQARFLQIMAEQAARMNRLIDDLLSLSRIELSEHQRPTDEILLPDLLRWTIASFEPRVNERGIHLELIAPPDLPPVDGDEDQLGQVLQNLLDNAVKYGREGGTVRVVAALANSTRWPARPGLTIAVSDDGNGIPREHLSRLTERFYRVDKGRSRAVGGTGLGLAIVKHIVNRHRGQLAIDSQEGEGATFTVWLPTATPKPAE